MAGRSFPRVPESVLETVLDTILVRPEASQLRSNRYARWVYSEEWNRENDTGRAKVAQIALSYCSGASVLASPHRLARGLHRAARELVASADYAAVVLRSVEPFFLAIKDVSVAGQASQPQVFKRAFTFALGQTDDLRDGGTGRHIFCDLNRQSGFAD